MPGPTTVLILGNHRNALSVARQLGHRHRIVFGGSKGAGRVERSRFVAETWPLPDAGDENFADALELLLRRLPEMPVLFPIGDVELFAMLGLPSAVKGEVTIAMPAPGVVATCLDKASNIELASALQIPQAEYRRVVQLSDLEEAAREVGFPCIIKSDHQLSLAFGKKAYRIFGPQEIAPLVNSEPEPEHGLIVQALASGIRHNVYFAAEHGQLVGAMEARVLRTTIHDGSGFTVESESVPLSNDLLRPTEQLVESLNYHGIGNTQFLVDQRHGNISFLEISPRMGAAYAVTIPCGFDFASAALALALGNSVPANCLPHDYPDGRRLAWSYGDLAGLIRARKHGDVGAGQAGTWLWHLIRAAIRADIHATWSWRDPRPTLSIAGSALGRLI